MKAKVTRKNIFLLSTPTIMVLAIAATLFWLFDSMKTADKLRMQTTLSINNSQKILSSIADSEIGTRGYILTKDTAFLKPYSDTRATIENRIKRLRDISDTQKALRKLINSFLSSTRKWIFSPRQLAIPAALRPVIY